MNKLFSGIGSTDRLILPLPEYPLSHIFFFKSENMGNIQTNSAKILVFSTE